MTETTYWRALDRFRAVVAAHPDREAVIHAAGRTTADLPEYRRIGYAELDAWSDAIAEHLTAGGVARGTRTIVLVTPGPELYAVLYGLFKVGAVPVVIDPGMGLRKMLRCLRAADAEAFIGVPEAHAVRILFRGCFRRVRLAVTVGGRWFWGGPTLAGWGRTPTRPVPERTPAPDDDPLLIAYTTGSTGPAKAVVLTHGNISAMVDQVDAARERVAPGTSLITAPVAGILELLLGSRCVLPPLISGKVGSTDPAHVADAVTRFGVRTMFASPAVLVPLLRHLEITGASLPTLQSIYSGGAPVPDWCIAGLRRVLSDDVRVYAGYGSTEALPMSTIESRELLGILVERAHEGAGVCVGHPAKDVRARIVAITDDPLPTWADAQAREAELAASRGIGELVVSGPNVSTRYYWPESANVAGKIVDGDTVWHRTGDLAWIDEQGRIWFCGRKSQRVQTADGPLFTVQIEQVFNTVPGVARTALVGVGPEGAKHPVLCVETEPGADIATVTAELRVRRTESPVAEAVSEFLFHPKFPVDIRHNAKIGRERLAVWAARQEKARVS
ncbi:AMP-binding protein [Nocardia terpenica]|uniref:fatty acid CoA ligase family protein n=1 Tax=Nocardia terpenica TaxID=455432 RepID=UPI001893CDFB|nr:fatty acid CoA ligase family protein [Nocardia terpenica]MBF6065460.1 AMP-binding protein [Nocardia terpenica]MBF6109142.1 AMP-binding protein [Nocardia terpenica]MBF6114656.1 AMP-binding protein [Nocardia terpenica]MBF6123341.1 AMP-binding protein [Nocardia terpenica]MBF6156641.1 AMP-binding protein [Nocardia terpenica]